MEKIREITKEELKEKIKKLWIMKTIRVGYLDRDEKAEIIKSWDGRYIIRIDGDGYQATTWTTKIREVLRIIDAPEFILLK